MAENTSPINTPNQVNTKVNLVFSTPIPSLSAHHMIVQQDESDVVVSFFELLLPIIPEDPELRAKAIEALETNGVVAECVAKIRIAKHRYGNFVKALSETNDRINNEITSLKNKYTIDTSDES